MKVLLCSAFRCVSTVRARRKGKVVTMNWQWNVWSKCRTRVVAWWVLEAWLWPDHCTSGMQEMRQSGGAASGKRRRICCGNFLLPVHFNASLVVLGETHLFHSIQVCFLVSCVFHFHVRLFNFTRASFVYFYFSFLIQFYYSTQPSSYIRFRSITFPRDAFFLT